MPLYGGVIELRNNKFETVDEIIEMLIELDTHCSFNGIYAKLVILGGSGILINLALKGTSFRPTNDIDVEAIASSDLDKLYRSLAEYQIHPVGGVMDVPPMEDLTDEKSYRIYLIYYCWPAVRFFQNGKRISLI